MVVAPATKSWRREGARPERTPVFAAGGMTAGTRGDGIGARSSLCRAPASRTTGGTHEVRAWLAFGDLANGTCSPRRAASFQWHRPTRRSKRCNPRAFDRGATKPGARHPPLVVRLVTMSRSPSGKLSNDFFGPLSWHHEVVAHCRARFLSPDFIGETKNGIQAPYFGRTLNHPKDVVLNLVE
jgi:hypothetical protein